MGCSALILILAAALLGLCSAEPFNFCSWFDGVWDIEIARNQVLRKGTYNTTADDTGLRLRGHYHQNHTAAGGPERANWRSVEVVCYVQGGDEHGGTEGIFRVAPEADPQAKLQTENRTEDQAKAEAEAVDEFEDDGSLGPWYELFAFNFQPISVHGMLASSGLYKEHPDGRSTPYSFVVLSPKHWLLTLASKKYTTTIYGVRPGIKPEKSRIFSWKMGTAMILLAMVMRSFTRSRRRSASKEQQQAEQDAAKKKKKKS